MKKKLSFYALIAIVILVLIPFVGQGQPKDVEKRTGPPLHVLETVTGPPIHVQEKIEQKQQQVNEKIQEKLQNVAERVKNPKALEAKLKQAWKRQIEKNYSEEEMELINQISSRLQNNGYQTMQVENIFANGKSMKFDVPPVIKDGRTLIPVRSLSAAYGFEVDYDSDTRTVSLDRDDLEIEFELDENIAIVNGEEHELDVPASSLEGRSVLPLRFFIEQLGIDIQFNNADKTIGIGIDPEEVEELYEDVIDEIEDAIEKKNELQDLLTEEDKEQIDSLIDDLVQLANDIDNAIEKEIAIKIEEIEEDFEEIEEDFEVLFEKYEDFEEEINLENYLDELNKQIINSISKRDARKANLTDEEINEVNDLIEELLLISDEIDNALENNTELDMDDIDDEVEDILDELENYLDIDDDIEDMTELRDDILEDLDEVNAKLSIIEDSLSEEELDKVNEYITNIEAIALDLEEAIEEEVILTTTILEDEAESYFDLIENILDDFEVEDADGDNEDADVDDENFDVDEMTSFSEELDNLINELVDKKELNEENIDSEDIEEIDELISELVTILEDVDTAIINEEPLDIEELEEEVQDIEEEINEYFYTEA